MDINYELYKVFYYVATSLSFSEASKKLFISQSAVSQSIKTLEKKLGQPLFIRSTKRVQLTPSGTILLKHIEPAMNLISRGESQLLDSGNLGLGQLHIGASDTICRYFLVPFTNFVSVLSQVPETRSLLPLTKPEIKPENATRGDTIYEEGSEEVFNAIIPEYLGGILYGALCESRAAEQAARRSAMDSATQNADEMIADLSLKFNRARQAAITQEITEIVAGS